MAFYNEFPEYVPVAEKKRIAERAVEKLKEKGQDISPIVITGRTITKTWWGKSWCDNLESYSDYSNRIDRGRSYVRHGAVLDLQISEGNVTSLVQGSTSKPYKVEIMIAPLSKMLWDDIVKECAGKINSLQELMGGKFPKGLSELFTMKGKGLFPAPKEIKLACSCPDSAKMCKHVAAALYGVGARLDEDAALFFSLRGVDIDNLISLSLAQTSESMLGKSKGRSRRVMEDADISELFGIELDMGETAGKKSKRAGTSPSTGVSISKSESVSKDTSGSVSESASASTSKGKRARKDTGSSVSTTRKSSRRRSE
ncbi:SWIM zinc finger family protein [Paenibacillus paridis]|uniref:SWIM zinc finger family protein n=1 Tax=Paenibacillus paridis TaxID=2583376 RepID=UPI001120E919|nr:SWIM zinc finger family protein [Paenibacillus paridis]